MAARCGQAKQTSTSKATLPCVNVQCQRTALQAVQSSDRWSSHCPALTCGAWAWRAPWEPAARSAARTHPAPIPPPCKQRPRKCWHSCNQGLCVRLLVLAQHPLRHPASAQQIKRPVATCNAPVQAAACAGRCGGAHANPRAATQSLIFTECCLKTSFYRLIHQLPHRPRSPGSLISGAPSTFSS